MTLEERANIADSEGEGRAPQKQGIHLFTSGQDEGTDIPLAPTQNLLEEMQLCQHFAFSSVIPMKNV